MQVVLEVSCGVQAGEKTWLRPGQAVRVGRTEQADFVFGHDEQMSGLHFRVGLESGACMLRDLESRNGTFLNGQRITETEIHDGGEIRAGQTTFTVQMTDPSREAERTAISPLSRGEPTSGSETQLPAVSGVASSARAPSPSKPFSAGPRDAEAAAVGPDGRSNKPLPATLILETVVGPGAGEKREVRPGTSVRVGRSGPADYAIPGDVQMSRVHFSVHGSERYTIRDLNSSNGTHVNGKRIDETTLSSGDHIVAGLSTFRVTVETVAPKGEPAVSSTVPVAAAVPVGGSEPPGDAPVLQIVNHTPFEVALMPWEDPEERPHLTVIVKGTFTIENHKQTSLAEEQLPIFADDEPFRDEPGSSLRYESDLVPFKPRADVVVVGKVHAPQGAPVTQLDVSVRVGNVTRSMRVFGDRKWSFPTLLAAPRISAPEPFVTMELVYERAFGGIDAAAARYCKENLAGTGFIGKLSPDSMHGRPLPNIEDPDNLIETWDTHPKPVGFGFYGRGWMPRIKHLGTYDEEYRSTRSPRPPVDFSDAFYNGAHPDLQVNGHLRGDEVVELVNLSAISALQFQLPGWRPKVTVARWSVSPEQSGEMAVRQELPRLTEAGLRGALDTLVLIPGENRGYLVHRAVCALTRLDGLEISRIEVM